MVVVVERSGVSSLCWDERLCSPLEVMFFIVDVCGYVCTWTSSGKPVGVSVWGRSVLKGIQLVNEEERLFISRVMVSCPFFRGKCP